MKIHHSDSSRYCHSTLGLSIGYGERDSIYGSESKLKDVQTTNHFNLSEAQSVGGKSVLIRCSY